VSLDWFTTRERGENEVLPWDDCRWTPCFDCGVCPTMGTAIEVGPTGRKLLPLSPV
jgi:hypothetical protein